MDQEIILEVSTFEDDLLDLSAFAERLEKFIEVEQHFVQGSLVLALSSKFGYGKTTFLKMWKFSLESGENESDRPLVISLNAWESDYYGDPLFAIISSLIESLKDSDESVDSLISAAKDFGWFTTTIAGQIANKFTGVDAFAAGELAEKKKVKREDSENLSPDSFSIYEDRKRAMANLQDAIKEFVANLDQKVLFLVDELDRCRPDYAISYLETIKHIFDVEGAVFILAADRQQLENSAKTAFGPDLDFEEYYRKFVHREITLPPISETGYKKLAETYLTHYLEREGLRNCIKEIDPARVENIVELVGALRLTPRQLKEMLRILGHILESREEKERNISWCIVVGSIAMTAFKVGNLRIFHQLGTQKFDPNLALEFLSDLLPERASHWWFMIFLSGGGLKLDENESMQDVLTKLDLIDGKYRNLNNLERWEQGWGYSSSSRFVQIYEKIEQISQWK